jgi:hypothetical protein
MRVLFFSDFSQNVIVSSIASHKYVLYFYSCYTETLGEINMTEIIFPFLQVLSTKEQKVEEAIMCTLISHSLKGAAKLFIFLLLIIILDTREWIIILTQPV